MKPKDNNKTGCVNLSSSDCITWTGPDIECVGVETGMSMTEVEHALACKICEIVDSLDVTDLDLSCLIEQTSVNPEDRDVRFILEVLLENQCSLRELIDNIDSGGTDVELNLNLRCLRVFDDFGNEVPQDLNQTLQSIINQVCQTVTDVTTLQNQVDDIQDQIDNLPEPPDPYEEPLITTCIAISRPVSEQVILISDDYCLYKTIVGSNTQIQAALAQQCDNLNIELGSEIGWNNAPQNMAQSLSNAWIALCDARARIKAMELTCCAPSCDKVKIGFIADFDLDNIEVTLSFTSGAGTSIPVGFVDCGTVLTITDSAGTILTFNDLEITQGAEVGPLSIVGLLAGTLEFNFKTKFCLLDENETTVLTCQDCIIQEVEYAGTGCCQLTNTSSSPVTIIYNSPLTNNA